MKNWIWRASTVAFSAALAGTVACGSSSSCSGTNLNSNTASGTVNAVCGPGTRLYGNQCVPTSAPSAGTPTATNTN